MKNLNKTFTDGPYSHLNACVGNNTGGDSEYGYVKGFSQAVSILISAAQREKFIDPVTGENEYAYMDALIYPIGFCARHHIELFLKRQIQIVRTIRPNEQREPKGHDLSKLWDELEQVCAADRRLIEKVGPIKEYVKDFSVIDATGQTFRYQYDAENGDKHLAKFGRINLQTLALRLKKLEELVDDFEAHSTAIAEEYSWKTYTNKLSRTELHELSVMLPDREYWGAEEFHLQQKIFMEKYSLSGKDFCRATKAILAHREFSALIGVEIPLNHILADIFEKIKIYNLVSNSPVKFSLEELSSLNAIDETSRVGVYSETYDYLFNKFISDKADRALIVSDLARTIRGPSRRFREGLVKLGQKTLMEAFDLAFPPPPAKTEAEKNKERMRQEEDMDEALKFLLPSNFKKMKKMNKR
jgi:hypothetical protein